CRSRSPFSEYEFDDGLQNARIADAADRSETADIDQFAGRVQRQISGHGVRQTREVQTAVVAVELGVIENVESLEPQTKLRVFGDRDILLQGHIPVVDARAPQTITRTPEADAADGRKRECRRVEMVVWAATYAGGGVSNADQLGTPVRRASEIVARYA